MTTTRTNIKDIIDAESPRKTHPSLSTTGIDLIVLKTIDDLAKEVKENLKIIYVKNVDEAIEVTLSASVKA